MTTGAAPTSAAGTPLPAPNTSHTTATAIQAEAAEIIRARGRPAHELSLRSCANATVAAAAVAIPARLRATAGPSPVTGRGLQLFRFLPP
jgi:hypothetical protein